MYIILTLGVHVRTPAASLGSQLCGTGLLAPALAGSSLWDVADRSQEEVMVGADHNEAHWNTQTQYSIYDSHTSKKNYL